LEQEPELDPEKTVLDVVKEGVADVVAILDEYNKINDDFGLPEVYEDADKMQKTNGYDRPNFKIKLMLPMTWELDNKLEVAMDALRTPPSESKN